MSGVIQRESFDASKGYRSILWLADVKPQEWSFNEMQAILDIERQRLAGSVWKDAGIAAGFETSLPGTGQLVVASGLTQLLGRVHPVAGATLQYAHPKTSGVDTVFVRWLMDRVTRAEDPLLYAPATGDDIEERIRVQATLATAAPDVLDEAFETWDGAIPRNWTRASGNSDKGYPAKFGETALRFIHTTGTETRVERTLALTPLTLHHVYYWVRTVDGKTDLIGSHGAYVDLQRAAPSWNPTDDGFATTSTYTRHAFSVTADASAAPVTLRIVIPASAPSTEVLVDAVLVTSSPMAELDLDRHYYALLFWDRATDEITRAVARPSNLRMQDLEPPLDGTDIINLADNPGFLDFEAQTTFDEHGHYRVPPGLLVTADPTLDAAALVGLRVAGGRAYVRGYRVLKPLSTGLQIDKALTSSHISAEGHTMTYGANLIALNKALGAGVFPIKEITAVTAQVEEVLSISRGNTPNTADDLAVVNVTSIQSASQGAAGSLTGSATGPFVFTEANNTLKLTVTNYDGTAGAEQTLVFNRGAYTIAEVVDALMSGSGRAYRSGKIIGNVVFANDGTGKLKISTKTRSTSSTVTMGGAGSTANTLLGFTNGQTNTGTGTHYALTTSWLQAGNSIDWSPGGAEPAGGTSFTVVVRRTVTLAETTDYVLGGLYASEVDRYYKVVAWGPDGEGEASVAVHLVVPIGAVIKLSWASVANAVSYHIYRSDDAGSTYNFLLNTTATSVKLDGSMTPDSGVHPMAFPSTTTKRAGTQLNGGIAGGETTPTVDSTTGFEATGTAFIDGSEQFTYAGVNATHFTGVPANGAGAIDAAHGDNAHVTQGPGMGTLLAVLDSIGVLNLNPQGVQPIDGTVVNISYDYYLPRTDRITIDRNGVVTVLAGVPSEYALPPAIPDALLELAQVTLVPNSGLAAIVNMRSIDRLTVVEVQRAVDRIAQLFQNDVEQQILNQIDKRSTTAKKGLFADSFTDLSQQDPFHPDYAALVSQVYGWASVPAAISLPTLAVNAGPTTAVAVGTQRMLPSTEITLLDQPQWSEEWNINPYAAFGPPDAKLRLTPSSQRWASNNGALNQWQQAAQTAALIVSGRDRAVQHALNWESNRAAVDRIRAISQDIITRSIQLAQDAAYMSAGVQILVEGVDYSPTEDNIAVTFGGVAVVPTPVAPGAAGTNPNTVKADAVGRWAATILVPASIGVGVHDVRGKGPLSDASAAFTGLSYVVPLPPPIPPAPADPLSESFYAPEDWTLGAIDFYFTAKDASLPVTVLVRSMSGGFPGDRVLGRAVLAPADVSVTPDTPTKVAFTPYITIPSGTSFCISLITQSNAYKVQTATLGKIGQNPAAWITSNPYADGTFFASGDGKTWSAFQGTDFRMKLYGRTFSASAVLEFDSIGGVSFSDLWLGADQAVPEGTTVTWEYELNGDGVPRPFEPENKQLLDAVATSVLLRARLATTIAKVSPALTMPTLALWGFLNALAGKVIWRLVEFSQNLTSADVYVYAALPSGTTMTWYLSNDDGATWDLATVSGTVDVDGYWSEVHLAVTFSSAAHAKLRVRCDLGATTPIVVPQVGHLGVTVQ